MSPPKIKKKHVCIQTESSVLLISDSNFSIISITQHCWQLFSILYLEFDL